MADEHGRPTIQYQPGDWLTKILFLVIVPRPSEREIGIVSLSEHFLAPPKLHENCLNYHRSYMKLKELSRIVILRLS